MSAAPATTRPVVSNAVPRYCVRVELLPPEEDAGLNKEQDFKLCYRPNQVRAGPPQLGQVLGLDPPTEIRYIGGAPPYGSVRAGTSRERGREKCRRPAG